MVLGQIVLHLATNVVYKLLVWLYTITMVVSYVGAILSIVCGGLDYTRRSGYIICSLGIIMNNKAYRIALWAIMFALIFVGMMLDRAVSLALPVSMALIVLVVTFSCMFTYNRWSDAIMAGLFMGIASMVKELIFPSVSFVYNINPLVSVLPRVAMAVMAFATYRLVLWCMHNSTNRRRAHIVALVCGVLVGLVTNTVLYLSALNWYKQYLGDDYTALSIIIKAVIYTNIIPEYLVSLIGVPFIAPRVRRAMHLGVEGKMIENNDSEVIA